MKMSSRDDETLPLSGFSADFSADVTVDEDFIPTSQPQSVSSKVTKSGESSSLQSADELNTQLISGFVNDTLPPEALIQESQDKSVDFIPDTETKRRKINYSNEVTCRKKLQVFGAEDIFASPMEKDKEPQNLTSELQSDSIFCDSPLNVDSPNLKTGEGSVTEIIVNDSAETVQLEETPVKNMKLEVVGKFESCDNLIPDKCEETQVFDNSVLVLDQPEPFSESKVTQDLYLNETVDDEPESKSNLIISKDKEQVIEDRKQNGVVPVKNEPPISSASQDVDSDIQPVRRTVDFPLTVSCLISINPKTKEVIRKSILTVNERKPNRKPSPRCSSDFMSDKSKRCSSSSSGSVYSDKNGLPFALPKRVSSVSDQTSASDSSEDNFGKILIREKRNLERIPWANEYLLALKMDDIIKKMVEDHDLLNRPLVQSPKKPKTVLRNDFNHLEHISENSSSEQTLNETNKSDSEKAGKEDSEYNISSTPQEVEQQEKPIERTENESNDSMEGVESEKDKSISEDPKDVKLCDGLRVFARWTDKQYYSGVLSGQGKNDKWDVLFDDGTLKAIKQDFIMPAAWLKVGTLVFVLVDDDYEPGQITELKWGENPTFAVQLDNGKQNVKVQLSDICFTDDLSSILRENYRPLALESPRGKADVDCDNVISGKRLREHRTPLRPPTRIESSGSKKKPSSKDSERIRETPKKKKSERKGGLKTENGHLVEDKDPSAGSPSGNETRETPLREARSRVKPRSLTYEAEERQKKRKQNNWLTDDGTPIPGPSGVKFRKKKAEESPDNSFEKSGSNLKTAEKNKRKRKPTGTGSEETPNKSVTETEVRTVRGRRK